MSSTLCKSMTTNNGDDISQTNREVNNGQKVSANSMSFNRKVEEKARGVTLKLEQDMEG